MKEFVQGEAHNFLLTITKEVRKRMNHTHFGGKALAGNFFAFEMPRQVLEDDDVLQRLIPCIEETIDHIEDARLNAAAFSLEIEMPRAVGWAETAQKALYPPTDLEEHPITRSTKVTRVKLSSGHKAPLTNTLTIVGSVKWIDDHPRTDWIVRITKIYPGEDRGPLKGDMRNRELVFFDRSHRGEPLVARAHDKMNTSAAGSLFQGPLAEAFALFGEMVKEARESHRLSPKG